MGSGGKLEDAIAALVQRNGQVSDSRRGRRGEKTAMVFVS
jgi:hypothetical protein